MGHKNRSNSQHKIDAAPVYTNSKILTVTDIHTLQLGESIYKFLINDPPVAFNSYLKIRFDIHDYLTKKEVFWLLYLLIMLFELVDSTYGIQCLIQPSHANLNLPTSSRHLCSPLEENCRVKIHHQFTSFSKKKKK